jgi:hypothetical protein
MKTLRAATVAIALAMVALPSPVPAASALAQLRGIAELKSWFNGAKGHPRLIFLLSPT